MLEPIVIAAGVALLAFAASVAILRSLVIRCAQTAPPAPRSSPRRRPPALRPASVPRAWVPRATITAYLRDLPEPPIAFAPRRPREAGRPSPGLG